jgi:hypothetical protein
MKPLELFPRIFACGFAAFVIIGVVWIITTRRQYMDAISYMLAAICVMTALAFVGFTFLLKLK